MIRPSNKSQVVLSWRSSHQAHLFDLLRVIVCLVPRNFRKLIWKNICNHTFQVGFTPPPRMPATTSTTLHCFCSGIPTYTFHLPLLLRRGGGSNISTEFFFDMETLGKNRSTVTDVTAVLIQVPNEDLVKHIEFRKSESYISGICNVLKRLKKKRHQKKIRLPVAYSWRNRAIRYLLRFLGVFSGQWVKHDLIFPFGHKQVFHIGDI